MNEGIQKEINEFFKIPEKDIRAIDNRVDKRKAHTQDKTDTFIDSNLNKNVSVTQSDNVQQSVPFNMLEDVNKELKDFKNSFHIDKDIKQLSILDRINLFFNRFKNRIGINLNYRFIIFLIIIFLISIFIGSLILSPEKPPLILE